MLLVCVPGGAMNLACVDVGEVYKQSSSPRPSLLSIYFTSITS